MIKITGLFAGAAVLFGLVHDQVTARVCLEYFTIGHDTIVKSTSPTILGLAWGVRATWWGGALVGLAVSVAAFEGPWPKLAWRQFVRPAVLVAGLMSVTALGAGTLGYLLTYAGAIPFASDYQDLIAPDRQARFMADVWAHAASYIAGLVGGIAVVVWTLRLRWGLWTRSISEIE